MNFIKLMCFGLKSTIFCEFHENIGFGGQNHPLSPPASNHQYSHSNIDGLGGRWRGKVQISPKIHDFKEILRNFHKFHCFLRKSSILGKIHTFHERWPPKPMIFLREYLCFHALVRKYALGHEIPKFWQF